MSTSRSFCKAIGALMVVTVSTALCSSLWAAHVRYSWAGTIVPTDQGDPWGVGLGGEGFHLDVDVPAGAVDLQEVNVEFAAHDAASATLTIGGEELTFVGPGVMDFTDNHVGLYDLVTFHGVFERFGQEIEFGTGFVLRPDAYEFQEFSEFPVAFGSEFSSLQMTCCGGVYASTVAAGAVIMAQVVPEPGVGVLAAVMGFVLGGSRTLMRRRYIL
jgi:hypothetical protein